MSCKCGLPIRTRDGMCSACRPAAREKHDVLLEALLAPPLVTRARRDRLVRAVAAARARAEVAEALSAHAAFPHAADYLEALGKPEDRLRRADVVAWLRSPVTAAAKALADLQAEMEGQR